MAGFFARLRADIKNYDRTNTSEACVLESNYFSAYKNVTVFRIRTKRSGSFKALFIAKKGSDADTVRHEYGHRLQLDKLGMFRYFLCIFIPSWRQWGKGNYYDKPWEVTADILGEVRGRRHHEGCIKAGNEYLERRIGMKLTECLRENRRLRKERADT